MFNILNCISCAEKSATNSDQIKILNPVQLCGFVIRVVGLGLVICAQI